MFDTICQSFLSKSNKSPSLELYWNYTKLYFILPTCYRSDLKPDNVGISIDGTVKLFDFGLCRDLPKKSHNCSHRNSHSSSNSGSSNSNDYKRERETLYRMSTVGTRRYMSPEVISGFCYNQKTDVYSWSMVRTR